MIPKKTILLFLLLSRVLEFCYGSICLERHGVSSPVPVLLRSVWEAYLDICLIVRHDDGYQHVLADWYYESIKKLEKLNEVGFESDEKEQREVALSDYVNKYNDLKRRGYKHRKQKEKFDMSGVAKEIELVNSCYSCDSHNNIISLARQHAEGGRFGGEIVFLKKHEDDYPAFVLHYVLLFTVGSLTSLSQIYKCNKALIAEVARKVEDFGSRFAAMSLKQVK